MDIKCFSSTQNFSFIFRYVKVGLALTGAVHPLGQPQHLGRHLSTESLTPEDHCTFQTSGDNTQAPWRSTGSKAEQTRARWRSECGQILQATLSVLKYINTPVPGNKFMQM